jgi:polysaccharide biosynthesis protein PslG
MNRIPSVRRSMTLGLISVALLVVTLSSSCLAPAPAATATPTKTPFPTASPVSAIPTAVAPSSTAPVRGASPQPAASPTKPANTPAPVAVATPKPVAASGDVMTSPDFGVQTFMWWREEVADRDLQLVKEAGFRWVKQLFSWQDVEGAGKGTFDWTKTDRIVAQTEKYGLKLLVRISADPDRAFWGGLPPANTKDFSEYAGAVAQRYRGRIAAYQVWNEPNLAREWGGKRPDPAAYTKMLKATYDAIKKADATALVITAGMAPTTRDDDAAMPDLKFYQGIYDSMGGSSKGYYDMLGVHGTGWAVAPETDPQVVVNDPKLHNNDPSTASLLRVYAFRHVEDVRALMEKNGDKDKKVVILEFGWTTDNRPDSPYYWHGAGAGIDDATQAKYLVNALRYAKEHWQPWVGLMSIIYMPDIKWSKNDEQYWWSIVGPGYPDQYFRAAYVELCIYLNSLGGQRCKYDPNPK